MQRGLHDARAGRQPHDRARLPLGRRAVLRRRLGAGDLAHPLPGLPPAGRAAHRLRLRPRVRLLPELLPQVAELGLPDGQREACPHDAERLHLRPVPPGVRGNHLFFNSGESCSNIW